uniref:Uncharacterized protein n=1 Tax=Rhizophora mucronata TaxID=61149 RepID=A0A2P2ND01_RHIMU
MIGLGPARITC